MLIHLRFPSLLALSASLATRRIHLSLASSTACFTALWCFLNSFVLVMLLTYRTRLWACCLVLSSGSRVSASSENQSGCFFFPQPTTASAVDIIHSFSVFQPSSAELPGLCGCSERDSSSFTTNTHTHSLTHSLTHTHTHTHTHSQVFFDRKSSLAGSEAGDSGIDSQALGDISEQELNSQEDLTFDTTILSPKRPSLDSLPLSSSSSDPSFPVTNGLSGPSTPTASVVSGDSLVVKALHHSISNSTNTSSISSSSNILAGQLNDE